jgi:hypothetical protein
MNFHLVLVFLSFFLKLSLAACKPPVVLYRGETRRQIPSIKMRAYYSGFL